MPAVNASTAMKDHKRINLLILYFLLDPVWDGKGCDATTPSPSWRADLSFPMNMLMITNQMFAYLASKNPPVNPEPVLQVYLTTLQAGKQAMT
jgi:hypothetical protein